MVRAPCHTSSLPYAWCVLSVPLIRVHNPGVGVCELARMRAAELPVVYQGMDWLLVFRLAAIWELMYQLGKALCQRSPHAKIRLYGASYCTAFSNALVCTIGSIHFTLPLLHAPAQSHVARGSPSFLNRFRIVRNAPSSTNRL